MLLLNCERKTYVITECTVTYVVLCFVSLVYFMFILFSQIQPWKQNFLMKNSKLRITENRMLVIHNFRWCFACNARGASTTTPPECNKQLKHVFYFIFIYGNKHIHNIVITFSLYKWIIIVFHKYVSIIRKLLTVTALCVPRHSEFSSFNSPTRIS